MAGHETTLPITLDLTIYFRRASSAVLTVALYCGRSAIRFLSIQFYHAARAIRIIMKETGHMPAKPEGGRSY